MRRDREITMTRRPVVLVTGAGGEVGHGLIHRLADQGVWDVLALDVRAVDEPVVTAGEPSPKSNL